MIGGGNGEHMKILVFSDSHGRMGLMVEAMENERPQRVFFLGDNYRDGQILADAYPEVPMDMVKGNCDFCSGPNELVVEVEGVRFLLTHGHKYYVKSGTWRLPEAAKKHGAAMVCFGHTHEGLNQPEEGIWLFNPGSAGGIHSRAGYGILTVENGTVRGDLK